MQLFGAWWPRRQSSRLHQRTFIAPDSLFTMIQRVSYGESLGLEHRRRISRSESVRKGASSIARVERIEGS
mgnify:CR=1 FL=1